jgi:FKBP-type peptidyl-prolyl cis-trans isomerase FklB
VKYVVAIGLVGGAVAAAWAAEPPAAAHPAQAKASYSLGYQLGGDLRALQRSGGPGPDLQALLKGVTDALSGARPDVTAQEMSKVLGDLRRQAERAARPAVTSYDARATQAFNALNAQREGVVTLENGLQYKVLQAGTGRQPQPNDTLTVNYKATLPNGVVVDSTYEDGEPAKLRLDDVTVAGLRQALGLMREGARWEVYVPPALGFSNEYSALRDRPMNYEVELISVAPAAGGDAAAAKQ